MSDASRLLRNRRYAMLALSRLFASIGEATAVTAIPLLVLEETRSGPALALVSGLGEIGHLAAFLPAGALVDRWECRRVMIAASVVRAVFAALTPLATMSGFSPILALMVGMLPISTFDTLYDAAAPASIPSITAPEDVARATSYLQAVSAFGFIITVGIAGLVVAAVGPVLTLFLEGAAFGLSAIALASAGQPFRTSRPGGTPSVSRAIREGVAFIWNQRRLRRLMLFSALMEFLISPLVVALSVYVSLDLGRTDSLFGFAIAAHGLGLVLGHVASAQLGPRWFEGRMCGGYALSGLALALGPLGGHVVSLLAAALVAGVGTAAALSAAVVVRTQCTPEPLQGRVASIGESLHMVLSPLGVAMAGLSTAHLSGEGALVALGALRGAICAGFAAWIAVASRRDSR